MKVSKPALVLLSAAVIIILVMLFSKSRTLSSSDLVDVKIGKARFKAEVADSFMERAKGLMFRKSMPKDRGMIFVFPEEDYYSFWMMNTSIPLDIIWISSQKRIVHIEKNAEPCLVPCKSYRPSEKAAYVFEINANLTEKHGIEIGDRVEFKV